MKTQEIIHILNKDLSYSVIKMLNFVTWQKILRIYPENPQENLIQEVVKLWIKVVLSFILQILFMLWAVISLI